MKQFKLLTLTTCVSLALVGCNNDDTANFTPRFQNTVLAADEAMVTAIDGYLDKAMVYPLDDDGECDTNGEPIGKTSAGKIKGKKDKLADGYCVVTTTETVDLDTPNETIEIGYTLYAPKPEYIDTEWETKQEVVVTPFSHYLWLAVKDGVDPEEAKNNLASDLGIDITGNPDHLSVLFGDFVHYKKEAKFKDIASKVHGFGRILVKIIGNKDEGSQLTVTETRNIARITRSYFDSHPDFLINLDTGDNLLLITFSQYIWANIDIIASGDTSQLDILINEVKASAFNEKLTKIPVLDAKAEKIKENIQKALEKSEFDINTGLNLGKLELSNIKISNAELDDPKTRLVLTQTVTTLSNTTTEFSASNATPASDTAIYNKDEETFTLKNDLLLKETGTYTYRLFIEKEIDGDIYQSNAAIIVLIYRGSELIIDQFEQSSVTIPTYIADKAPTYLGDESVETKEILKKFSEAEYVFEQASKLSVSIDKIDFKTLFDNEEDQDYRIEILANTEDFAGLEKPITYECTEGNDTDCKFSMSVDLPVVTETPTDEPLKIKEYRFSVRSIDALGKKSRGSFNLSIIVYKDKDGKFSAKSEFTVIKVNQTADGVYLSDLQLAVPITKEHEKALEETLETLLSGKTLAVNYSLDELLPIYGYQCEDKVITGKSKKDCTQISDTIFAADYQLTDSTSTAETVANILEIKPNEYGSDFDLINNPKKDLKYTWYLDASIFDDHFGVPVFIKYYEHDELDKDGAIKDYDKYKNYLRLDVYSKKDGKVSVSVKFDDEKKEILPTVSQAKEYQYIFPQEMNLYIAGTKVLHNGTIYECRSGKESSFCSQWSHEPGIGNDWQMAWIKIADEDFDPSFTNPYQPVDYEFTYPDQAEHYKLGTQVKYDNLVYQCISEKECQNASEDFKPGIGKDWLKAWKQVGYEGDEIDSGASHKFVDYEYHYPEEFIFYKLNTLVEYDDFTYRCISTNACIDLSAKYEPTVGAEWEKVWQLVGAAGNKIDHGFLIPDEIEYHFSYPNNLAFYRTGTLIEKDGFAYQCLVENLCNKYKTQYEPETGANWQTAWKYLGRAGNKIDDGFIAPEIPTEDPAVKTFDYDFNYPRELTSYQMGTLVENRGKTYECLSTDLCKDAINSEPGVEGFDWTKAWKLLGNAGFLKELSSN